MIDNNSIAICIGRFQLPHYGHLHLIEKALSISDKVIIILGSADKQRTKKNPFTWLERKEMLSLCLEKEQLNRISFIPIDDHPSDDIWAQNVTSVIPQNKGKLYLVGHNKDESSFYLSLFDNMEVINEVNIDDLHSTNLRELFYEDAGLLTAKHTHENVLSYLHKFSQTGGYDYIKKEKE